MKKQKQQSDWKRLLYTIIASVIVAANIKTFVRAGGLYPGGFNGLTLLIQKIGQVYLNIMLPFSLINFLLNSVVLIISFKVIGKKFTLYTCLMVGLTGILTDIIPGIPITSDILLIAIFGGIINGFAMSLCLMGSASTGGTDVIAIIFSEKYNMETWNYIFIGNVLILMIAGFLFGWNQALYSIIFQFTSTQIVHMLHLRYKKHTMFIISEHSQEIYNEIAKCTNHGATIFTGTGCYENEKRNMIYSVVSSDEVKEVMTRIRSVDSSAFINIVKTDQVNGRFYQKPND